MKGERLLFPMAMNVELHITREVLKGDIFMELTEGKEKELVSNYRESKQRLILLDYDGTLVPFRKRPEDANPDEEILKLLETLATDPKNEVVLTSGRDRDTMEKWFGGGIDCIAEHGALIKEKGKEWEVIASSEEEWKKEIRPILEMHVDKTHGSFIEEKEFSIAWHYRNVNPELGHKRAKELVDNLEIAIDSLNLQVLKENMLIEVQDASVNKGKAALYWTAKKEWDFILAIGDDRTDEDTFSVLPETAYSVKVGPNPSQARFHLDSFPFVLWLLKKLAEY